MTSPATNFTNPATGTSYRLIAAADGSWRITKSRDDHGRRHLTHWRGHAGDGAVPADLVQQLLSGTTVSGGACTPTSAYAAVVLRDLACTADLLTAVARESEQVLRAGCRGFRPRSPVLRQQRDRAMAEAVLQMQAMARAWSEAGLAVTEPLPSWLEAALADELKSAGKSGGI
ncbi:MAG TPA: hypothetical protein DCS97_14270 [Planctomycetes bacterium]|nr:hypothetical protein [Planctomycetota bacterium]